jgi:hypothetical protein
VNDPWERPDLTPGLVEHMAANLASLNEIIAELVAKVSDDPAFIEFTTGLLAGHSWSLGYTFQGQRGEPPESIKRPPGGWPTLKDQ